MKGLLSSAVLTFVLVACGDTSSLTLPPRLPSSPSPSSFTLTGWVRDTLMSPISGARVEIADGAHAGLFAITTSAGQFSIPNVGASPQGLTLRITRDGYSPVTRTVGIHAEVVIVLVGLDLFPLEGRYTMTFSAESSCTQIPAALRTRTYGVTFRHSPSDPSRFAGALDGADFLPGYGTLSVSPGVNAARFFISSWEAFTWWWEDHPIIERLPASGYLSLEGVAVGSPADAKGAVNATFDGEFAYCAAFTPSPTPTWPPVCTPAPVTCHSASHQLTIVPR